MTESCRVHTSVGVVNHAAESRTSVISTWTPGTPLAQAEETVKAAARQAITDLRDRFRGTA